jgi:1,4-alpha-glucan branching enzyme
VVDVSDYKWRDQDWMNQRARTDALKSPMSIYELHLGSWRGPKNYRDLAPELIGHVKYLGFTHVEFMPLAEHPFGGSWGYQVTGYYAPTSRFGTPDDLRFLIDELHNAGIGVILDWVPAHFPKDEWALAKYDGEAIYEDADPRRGDHPDWGTHVFNFGRTEVRNFLVANASYWLEEFHIDALRVDAVASMLYLDYSRKEGEWIPNEHGGRENLEAIAFLQRVNHEAYGQNPGIVTIAEESTAFPGVSQPTSTGGLGFGFKWNMGFMHDTLNYLKREPIHRKHHHNDLTFGLLYAFTENFVLPLSHDEVVHGKGSLLNKMAGDGWQKFATLRAYYAFMWGYPGKKLLFMGQELAPWGEWSEARGLDWHLLDEAPHRGVQALVRELNRCYRDTPALHARDCEPDGFEWLVADDRENSVYAWARHSGTGGPMVVVVSNFTPVPRHGYVLPLPAAGRWREILNTDAGDYGGSGLGNMGAVVAVPESSHGKPAHTKVTLPPLATLYFMLDS